MELRSSSRRSAANTATRRAWLLAPVSIAVGGVWWLTRQSPVPDASANGSGEEVTIALFGDDGSRLKTVRVRKLVKSAEDWRKQLGPESFAVTRQQATEFAYNNKYWNNHEPGIYRCICCGNALFSANDKYDSDTGWPSFTKPIAPENVATKPDRTLAEERVEVLCRKCGAHLGHLFNDGPAPGYRRYCLNSAALRLVHADR